MCLIVFAYQYHPEYRLILAANRDESYQRATSPAQFWPQTPDMLAGRDNEAGGTWLGISRRNRFAAVTNFREGGQQAAELSRGLLTTDFLTSSLSAPAFANQLSSQATRYSGYNLLLADDKQLLYCSNRSSTVQQIKPGIHALSNHRLDTPWPKSEHVRQEMDELLSSGEVTAKQLIKCMQRRTPFPDEQLPSTGVGIELERTLAPPFITTAGYGTRSTSIFLWKHDGSVTFVEQSYLPDGRKGEIRRYRW